MTTSTKTDAAAADQQNWMLHFEQDRRKAMADALRAQATAAEDLARQLRGYADQVEADEQTPGMSTSPSDRFGWAVNCIENFTRNIGYSRLMKLAAEHEAFRRAIAALGGK